MTFPTTGVIDNFNRSNEGPPPSASWTNTNNGIKVVSNAAKGATGSGTYNIAVYNAATYGPDAEAYVTISTLPDNTNGVGVGARITTLVASTLDGYYVEYDYSSGSTDKTYVMRLDNGVATQLGASISLDFVAGDGLGIEVIGSTTKAYRCSGGTWSDISSGGRTDATYTLAGYVLLSLESTVCIGDNFGGGTVVVTSTQPPRSMHQFRQRQI